MAKNVSSRGKYITGVCHFDGENNGRELEVTVWYPSEILRDETTIELETTDHPMNCPHQAHYNAKPANIDGASFPLILFSHGNGKF
mgnify:CR=1 FL=1